MLSIDCGLVRLSDAQIGLDYFVVLANRSGAAFRNLLPEIEYRDYVRNAHYQVHVVLDDKKGHTRRLDIADDARKVMELGRIETRSWLVEHKEQRTRCECTGYFQAALLAIGQVLRLIVRALRDV
jgi:hypothetical protein